MDSVRAHGLVNTHTWGLTPSSSVSFSLKSSMRAHVDSEWLGDVAFGDSVGRRGGIYLSSSTSSLAQFKFTSTWFNIELDL